MSAADKDWKIGYKRALISAFVKQATPVNPGDTYYGFIHFKGREIRSHLAGCGLDFDACTMPDDVTWSEFAGTFADSDNYKHGLESVVTCSCGRIREVSFRMDSSFSALLHAVLREG